MCGYLFAVSSREIKHYLQWCMHGAVLQLRFLKEKKKERERRERNFFEIKKEKKYKVWVWGRTNGFIQNEYLSREYKTFLYILCVQLCNPNPRSFVYKYIYMCVFVLVFFCNILCCCPLWCFQVCQLIFCTKVYYQIGK